MIRREVRDCAFKLVYAKLMRDDDIEDLYSVFEDSELVVVDNKVREMVDGVLAHIDEIDAVIAKYSKTRAVLRIAKLNLAILRIAIFEALYDDDTPVNAAISEAVLLSRKYTYEEDAAFINGILGSFSREAGNV